MAFRSVSSSSSSSIASRWCYDVFLSFRGEDTRDTFTAHLHYALRQKGINTDIDEDDFRRGDEISPALLKVIEESRIFIILFSENYALSTWCLDELLKIIECKEIKQQMVLPVFYLADPSEVRNQRGNFGEAFTKHEDGFKEDVKMQRWKAALEEVANLAGYHLGNGNESKFIQEILQEVSRIANHSYLNVAKYVGIEYRVQDINLLLSVGMDDIRMVGIFGIGGIGKTIIAKAIIYNSIAYLFEASCFHATARETSNRHYGLIQLQETLLSEILEDSRSLHVGNLGRGINVIKRSIRSKSVLLILDDVD